MFASKGCGGSFYLESISMVNTPKNSGSIKDVDQKAPSDADNQVLYEMLVESWKAGQQKDLEGRHEVGGLLNEHLGPPTERQAYGKGILKEAATRLSISASELTRMRWFAHHFKDLDDLKAGHPNVTNWTAVKLLLPKLSPNKADPVDSSGKLLEKLASAFREVPDGLAAEQKASLQQLIVPVLEEAKRLFSVSYSIDENVESVARSPDAAADTTSVATSGSTSVA